MKYLCLITLFLFSLNTFSGQACNYPKNNCPAGQFCINIDKGVSECREFDETLPKFKLPFRTQVWCDQGNLTPEGNSHSWWNSGFALDLYSSRDNKKEVPLYSMSAGKVIAFNKCKTTNDQCGAGFGNHVKVLSDNGILIHYTHLSKVVVTTGQIVKPGKLIGYEGETGWAGKNNPHLHLSIHKDWRKNGFDYWKQLGFVPPSIPFLLELCEDKCSSNCKKRVVDSRKLRCKRTKENVNPICSF